MTDLPVGNRGTFVKKDSYSYGDLNDSVEGRWGDSAPLPRKYMRLMTRITQISGDGGDFGKGFVRAEYEINPGLWFFDSHFANDPVMPGLLGADALLQLTGFFAGWSGALGKGRAMSVGGIGFLKEVGPTAKLIEYGVDISRLVKTRKGWFSVGDGWIKLDGEIATTAKDLKACVLPR